MTESIKFGGASADAPTEVMEVANGEVEGSLISNLRKSAKAQQKVHITDMPVGGEFGKRLQIRYQPLEPGAMDRYIARRAEIREVYEADNSSGLPFTEFNMDLMAQACVAVVGADESGENKIVLNDGLGVLRLEQRLAEFLELPIPEHGLTARDVILMIFGGNALAIVDHGDDLLGWLRDPTEQPNVGESSAPTGSTPSE
jgi:hypothetical protein